MATHYIFFIIHISTRTCHIHHNRGVTEVCHLGHFWLSYVRYIMSGSPTGHLVGLSYDGQTQQKIPEVYNIACFWQPHDRNVRKRHSSDPDEQMDRWMCSLGVCLYVLVVLEVDNLARD